MDYRILPWIAGNPLRLQIPLQIVTITADGSVTEDYEPQDGDTVTVVLRSQRSEKIYSPEIEGNIATIEDNGQLLIGEYAVETLVVESDGTKRRSYYPCILNVMKATPDMLRAFDDFPEYADSVMIDTPSIFFALGGGGAIDAYTKAQSDARYVKKIDMQAYSTTEEMLEIIHQTLLSYATTQYVDEKVQQASDGRPKVVITDERNVTLEEGKYYVFGECEELTINIGDQYTDGRLNKYMFEFDSPQDAATRLSLPANLRNVPSFAIVPDSHFVVAIQGNVVSMVGTNSYYPGAGDDDFFKDFFNRNIAKVVIPEGVGTITRYLFYQCVSLTHVVLPSTLSAIETYAFSGCLSLTTINFPEGLATIAERALENCIALAGILNLPTTLRSIGQYAFSACRSLTKIIISEGVTNIGNNAFAGCTGVTEVELPSTYVQFGTGVFSSISVTSFTIPSWLTVIPGSFLASCKSLTSITIPNTVTLIQAAAFSDCSILRSITLPNSIVELQATVFNRCILLTDVTVHDSITTVASATSFSGIGANATFKIIGTTRVIPFVTLPNTTKVYVDATMVARYKAASGWSGIASRIYPMSEYTE